MAVQVYYDGNQTNKVTGVNNRGPRFGDALDTRIALWMASFFWMKNYCKICFDSILMAMERGRHIHTRQVHIQSIEETLNISSLRH